MRSLRELTLLAIAYCIQSAQPISSAPAWDCIRFFALLNTQSFPLGVEWMPTIPHSSCVAALDIRVYRRFCSFIRSCPPRDRASRQEDDPASFYNDPQPFFPSLFIFFATHQQLKANKPLYCKYNRQWMVVDAGVSAQC